MMAAVDDALTSTPTAAQRPPAARRRWLMAGVAGAAAMAGAGVALWRLRLEDVAPEQVQRLWGLEFDTPQGARLSMAALKGKPLLINFWATWCPPCVEELPLLDRFYREHAAKGWQMIGLAIDQPSAVRKFLERTPVSFPVGLAGLGGTDLGKSLGNLSGGLPFTVVLGSGGQVAQRRMGRVTQADLDQWVQLR